GGVVEAGGGPPDAEDRVEARVRVAGADALVVEGGLQELALHGLPVGPVIAALPGPGLEVHGAEVLVVARVARRQDLAGPQGVLAPGGVPGAGALGGHGRTFGG